MEAQLAALAQIAPRLVVIEVAAVLGTLISLWLVRDAWRDRKLHQKLNDTLADAITLDRLVGELIRLILQLAFLAAALIFTFERAARFRQWAVFLLVAVPVVLATWSLFSWYRRQQVLQTKSQANLEAEVDEVVEAEEAEEARGESDG